MSQLTQCPESRIMGWPMRQTCLKKVIYVRGYDSVSARREAARSKIKKRDSRKIDSTKLPLSDHSRDRDSCSLATQGLAMVSCQSCTTQPKTLGRPELIPVVNVALVLHCIHCKKSAYENKTDPSDKSVANPYWEDAQESLAQANGDASAAFSTVIDEVHSRLQKIKEIKTIHGNKPAFLGSAPDDYSRDFVGGYVLDFASKSRVRFSGTGAGAHPVTELRLDPKPPLVDGLVTMILIDTARAFKTAKNTSVKACVHCNTGQKRYSIDTTSGLSFYKDIGCNKCIAQWVLAHGPLIPSNFGLDATMIHTDASVAAGKGTMENVQIQVLAAFVHWKSNGTFNPTPSQIKEDARKLEEKRKAKAEKEAAKYQQNVEKFRSRLPRKLPRLTNGEQTAAVKSVSIILDAVSKFALTVPGTQHTQDILVSSNYASASSQRSDGSLDYVVKNEDISHIVHKNRLFVMDAKSGVALQEGKLYDRHKYSITGDVDLGALLLRIREDVEASRKKGRCSVVTIQLHKICDYEDAKVVEKGGHTTVTANEKMIRMEDKHYKPGNFSKKCPQGVTNLCLFFDVCLLVKSGRARFCSTGVTQAFLNTINKKAPFTLDLRFWSEHGSKTSLATSKQQGVSRDNLGDTKPAANPLVESTKSASTARKGALRDLDANSITLNPPKKKKPNPSKPKAKKLRTPTQLRNMIVAKTGSIGLSTGQLEEMFERYDDAEFVRELPSINDANRARIILVVGSSGEDTKKARIATQKGVKKIQVGTFMNMLAS